MLEINVNVPLLDMHPAITFMVNDIKLKTTTIVKYSNENLDAFKLKVLTERKEKFYFN